MGKKRSDRSKNHPTGAERLNTTQSHTIAMADIPDFTPEQWEWLREQSRKLEKDYVPTRSLIPGL
jgi:hypothetical protein